MKFETKVSLMAWALGALLIVAPLLVLLWVKDVRMRDHDGERLHRIVAVEDPSGVVISYEAIVMRPDGSVWMLTIEREEVERLLAGKKPGRMWPGK